MADCKHCHLPITDGPYPLHLNRHGYPGKASCNPADSGLPYGYNADPEGEKCHRPCIGAPIPDPTNGHGAQDPN